MRLDPASAQRADDAEEARVAGGQHGGVAGGWQGVEGRVEVLELDAFGAGRDRGGRRWRGAPTTSSAAARAAAASGPNGRPSQPMTVTCWLRDDALAPPSAHAAASAIFVWPVKSTMMTWICGCCFPGRLLRRRTG